MLELFINTEESKTNILLVENGKLLEKHEEHENQKRIEGNIYIGKVRNILPGMQSAFIDIGEGKNTLIKLKDVLPKVNEALGEEYNKEKLTIEKILKPNMEIIVQVKRDGTQSKGAKVSTHINLPGRFSVLLPNTDIITVSQKIENKQEKERLLKIAKENVSEGAGVILRTSSENVPEEIIKEDINNLIKQWEQIESRIKTKRERLVYDNNALIRRTIIDIVDRNLSRITVNSQEIYKSIDNYLKGLCPDKNIEIRFKDNILQTYSLQEQIDEISKRKIWLKCGGFITIDRTEALTAIDVNTGKYTGKKEFENTVLKVNEEATIEIAKQLRLRDIGGIIIIDYIDMHIKENKEKVLNLLKENLKKDRTKCQVFGFTELNLLEMTRKNMCNND